MTQKIRTLKKFMNFEYISVVVPVRSSKYGELIDVNPHVLELMVAEAMIEHKIPLRGKEVKFIRKVLGLSLEKFAKKIGLTAGAILKWEKAEKLRLQMANEVICRAFFAEELGIEISSKFSELISKQDKVEPITLQVAS